MIVITLHTWLDKRVYICINSPLTVSFTSGLECFTRSCFRGVLLYSRKKWWLITKGFEPTITDSSLLYFPVEETFFLRSATCARNINWHVVVKTGTVGSVIKLKLVLTENWQNVDIFINKTSYFLTKFVNSLKKHNIADSEISYIHFMNSVWRVSVTFKMAECLFLACYNTFAH
jgi:hypothetical protein